MSPIADEIFVGSVSVGVVPDLRGFNDRMRAVVIPSANVLGRDMGKEMTRGISDSLGVNKTALDNIKRKVVDGLKGISIDIGIDVNKATLDVVRKKITVGLDKVKVNVEVDVSKVNLDATRLKIQNGLSGIKVNVETDVTKVNIANTKRKIRDGLKGININVGTSATATVIKEAAGAGGGGGGASGGGGIISGIGALFKALPGGTSGSVTAVPPEVAIPAAAVVAGSLPFIGQAVAGLGVSGLGAGLAGLGIAGAFGVGGQTQAQVNAARNASQAANLRVTAAQARLAQLQGGTSASPASIASAQAALITAQATRSGAKTSAQQQADDLRVIAAQDRLNKLREGGKATTSQLAAAEASLASARNTQAIAQNKNQQVEALRITAGQQAVRTSFNNLKLDALASLNQIGQAFVPVMQNIFGVASNTIKAMTPVFAGAVKIISGPFQVITDTVLKSFQSPQVKSSIDAVAIAFGQILTAFTPDIPGIMNSFADAIERIALAVSKNPKAFADFLNFIFQIGIFALNTIAFLTQVADWIESNWNWFKWLVIPEVEAILWVVNNFDKMRHDVAAIWDLMFENTIGAIIRFGHNVETQFNSVRHEVAVIFDGVRNDIAHTWDQIYSNTIGAVIRIWQRTGTGFADLRHNISNVMDGIRHDIANYWDVIFGETISKVIRQGHNVEVLFNNLRHDIADIYDGVRHDISSAWDTIWNNTVARVRRGWNDISGVFISGWNWIYSHVLSPMINFFTNTLPGAFDKAVTGITKAWNVIKNALLVPVRFVVNNVIDNLIHIINNVLTFIGSTNIPLIKMATGGRITAGTTPTADNVIIAVSRGETVVSEAHSRQLAPAFSAVGVPGYAGGGFIGPMPTDLGTGLGPGLGPMEGWFGTLGDVSRVAAVNFAGVKIFINKFVAGTVATIGNEIAAAYPGYVDSSTGGWRTQIGQSSTGIPYSMHQLGLAIDVNPDTNPYLGNNGSIIRHPEIIDIFKQHGWFWGGNWGPGSRDQMHFQLEFPSGQQGGLGALGGIVRSIADIFKGLGTSAKIGIDLAHGDTAGAGRAITDLMGKIGLGGAVGPLATMLGHIPAALISRAVKFMVKGVKAFASKNSTSYPGVPAASGSALAAQNFAKAHLAQFGWGMDQWAPQLALWNKESGWNADAVNPSSGAYGIPQSLGHGHPYNMGDYANQIMWGDQYIKGRYGSPAAAWAHEVADNWYGNGGWINEPVSGIGHYSGAMYTFAEKGREYVMPEGAMGARGGDGAAHYHAHFDGLTGQAIEGHVRTAFQAMSMTQGSLNRAGRRS